MDKFCSKDNITLINLFPVFEEKLERVSYKEVDKKHFIEDDEHWNSEGHALVKEY